MDVDEFLKQQNANKVNNNATPVVQQKQAAPSPSPKQSPLSNLSPEKKQGILGALFKSIGDALTTEKKSFQKDPVGTVKKTGKTLVQGAGAGGRDILATGVRTAEGVNALQDKLNPLKKILPTPPSQKGEPKLSDILDKKNAQIEKQQTKGLSPVQQVEYGGAGFAASAMLPGIGEEGLAGWAGKAATKVLGKNVIGKLVSAGVDNAAISSMLYNPQMTSETGKKESFMHQLASNFIMGTVAEAGIKVPATVVKAVFKPMAKALEAVSSPVNAFVNQNVYKRVVPDILEKSDPTTIAMDTKEIFDVLHGNKTSYDTTFFSSPQWKDVMKKYGANPDNYPERITLPRPDPLPMVEKGAIAKLPSNELHTVMKSHFDDGAHDLAMGDMNGFTGHISVMNDIADKLDSQGYVVDRKKLFNDIQDYSIYQKDTEDFNMAVLDQERKKSVLNDLDSNNVLKPLGQIRKMYGLIQNRKGYTDQAVANAYDKWAAKEGFGGIDELSEGLRKLGYEVNDIGEVISMAKGLPTIRDTQTRLTPPKEVNVATVVNDAIKPKPGFNKDMPFQLSQTELDRINKQKENPGGLPESSPDVIPKGAELSPNENRKTAQQMSDLKEQQIAGDIFKKETPPLEKMDTAEKSFATSGTSIKQAKGQAQGILREKMAISKNTPAILAKKYKAITEALSSFTGEKYINEVSTFQATGEFSEDINKALQKAGIDAAAYKKMWNESTDAGWQMLHDGLGLKAYIQNYMPTMIKILKTGEEDKAFSGMYQSFKDYSTGQMKQRKFATIKDATDYLTEQGIPYQLKIDNIESTRQFVVANARRVQAYNAMMGELKDKNLIRISKGNDLLPNEAYIQDRRMGEIFFKTDDNQLASGGRYVAPKEVASLINNTTSEGLFGQGGFIGKGFTGFVKLTGTTTQFNLGFSGFHLMNVIGSSIATDWSRGISDFATGSPIQAAKGVFEIAKGASIAGSVLGNYFHGLKIAGEIIDGTPRGEVLTDMVNKSGARIFQDNKYRDAGSVLSDAIKEHSIKSLASVSYKAPLALMEKLNAPLFKHIIPMVKLSVLVQDGDRALAQATENFTKDISKDDMRKVLGKVSDRNDNYFGEMVQDNLFWNNTVKDIANADLLSLGWTYGTLRGAFSAGKDIFTSPGQKKTNLTTMLAYPMAVMYMGAIVNYMNTGKAPKSFKQYFYPSSGKQNPDGSEQLLSIPNMTKDFFSYAKNPLATFFNKQSPLVRTMAEVMTGKDYYGVMLANPGDPALAQGIEIGKAAAVSLFTPFSVSSLVNMQKTSGNITAKDIGESFMGIQKAPANIQNTPTENAIQQAYSDMSGQKTLTPQEAADAKAKSDAKKQLRTTGDASALEGLIGKPGGYTRKGLASLKTKIKKETNKGETTNQDLFGQLPYDRQVEIYDKMKPGERSDYYPYVNKQAKQIIDSKYQ